MTAKNTETGFGWVTRVLHWLTALAVLVALPMGLWLSQAEISLATLKYFGYHKTLGICVLVLIGMRIAWHLYSTPPDPLSNGVGWQDSLAKFVHRSFYALLLAMPLSGWVGSSATGIDTVIFGQWTLPRIAPVSESWETAGFLAHDLIGKALMLCVLLHVGGALYHILVTRDGTLRRMIRGS